MKKTTDSVTVSQDSDLGGLCFTAFVEAGICGPPYSLKGISITVSWVDACRDRDFDIKIDFYDMTTRPLKGTLIYQLIKEDILERI